MGAWLSMMALGPQLPTNEMRPPPPTWDYLRDGDMPDLTGKITIVTGGNSGIGKETARALLLKNAKVYIAARSEERALAAIADLRVSVGGHGTVEFLHLDLGDLHSVKRAAEEFLSKEKRLDILFNNAGVMCNPVEQITIQKYDMQWGTNVLGPFYFTKLLLPALFESDDARVVNTSSSASIIGKIDFDSFVDGKARRKHITRFLYAQSKLGNIIVTKELARRYADKGLRSYSMNPGNIATDLQRHLMPMFMVKIFGTLLYDVHHGAITQLYAGTAPAAKAQSGEYFVPWARVKQPNPLALDDQLRERVWNWLEDQVKDL
ncbi:hypothetical protein BKA62DRAFT_638978 [Auriculariales sp. MPI-PUGE-AT-0066]|nr:hypothetical protein BKA62DRAFT_638978 [Auriculariales sp. MPI-PUGE-AT-0066]